MERELPRVEEELKELLQREAELWQLLRELRAGVAPRSEQIVLDAAWCDFLERCTVRRLALLARVTQPELCAQMAVSLVRAGADFRDMVQEELQVPLRLGGSMKWCQEQREEGVPRLGPVRIAGQASF